MDARFLPHNCHWHSPEKFDYTYYIKTAKGEIDVAAVIDGSAKAIEVKWTTQLRTQDVKMVCSVANGQIWADVPARYEINKIAVIPLPLALFDLGA